MEQQLPLTPGAALSQPSPTELKDITMKTLFAVFTALGFVLLTVGTSSAHLRLDETFVAPRVPDDIEVDGDALALGIRVAIAS